MALEDSGSGVLGRTVSVPGIGGIVICDRASGVHGLVEIAVEDETVSFANVHLWQGGRLLAAIRRRDSSTNSYGVGLDGTWGDDCIRISLSDSELGGELVWTAGTSKNDWKSKALFGIERSERWGRLTAKLVRRGGGVVVVDSPAIMFVQTGGELSHAAEQGWSLIWQGADSAGVASVLTKAGRDYAFGGLFRDGATQPLHRCEFLVGYAYRHGPPLMSRVTVDDIGGVRTTLTLDLQTVASTVGGDASGNVIHSHHVFGELEGGPERAMAMLSCWSSASGGFRAHVVARSERG